jgi:hypothetical protein
MEGSPLLDWTVGENREYLVKWYVAFQQRLRLSSPPVPRKSGTALRVCTYNVHFWLGPALDVLVHNVAAILDVIERCDADVLVLNECVPITDVNLLPGIVARLSEMGYIHNTLNSSPKWTDVSNCCLSLFVICKCF